MPEHPALEMAREARRTGEPVPPAELFYAAGEQGEVYRHAMYEAGHIVDKESGDAFDPCPVCGWSPSDQGEQEGLF